MTKTYFPGMGQAVADRTINRPGETWADVAHRVALGNSLIHPASEDFDDLKDHLSRATILMSGRHLQHGDETQPGRNQEVFTNCSTAMTRATCFYLLLNGSGVGSSYDDDIMIVDWEKYMPVVVPALSEGHKDYTTDWQTPEQARRNAEWAGLEIVTFKVPDSREGWAQAVEELESLTYARNYRNHALILDFSDVRPHGSPIGGMQNRPASGPLPLMEAFIRAGAVKNSGMAPWRAAMQIDHEFAECVLVGGARRSARIAVKYWKDVGILDFIRVKAQGGLWSANNSVGVDAEFWERLEAGDKYASEIFDAIIEQSYGNGEPGILNLDMLQVGERRPTFNEMMKVGHRFQLGEEAHLLREELAHILTKKKYWIIVNPCGEIRLFLGGGYCVIADVAPYHSKSLHDFMEAARLATRALIRTNMMQSFYDGEVKRTNRIGVGLTGIFEYAMSVYGLTFEDLIAEDPEYMIEDANGNSMPEVSDKAYGFWRDLREVAMAVEREAMFYSAELGVPMPATRRTIKPAGTTSKLFGLTEGAHLPSMREYLRWVQFRNDDPLILEYEAKGYPVRRNLKTYPGTTIVGFPTQLEICKLGPVTTAAEATPEQQVRWVRLLETFWLLKDGGNQISYTLKYDPKTVSRDQFASFMMASMPMVRAVSVMPQADTSAYEYQPEEPISQMDYDEMMLKITTMKEDADKAHVDCAGGFCPIDFNKSNVPAREHSASAAPVLV